MAENPTILQPEHKPSQTVEDYLQLIYTMHREAESVIPARLKDRMGVSAPTALATLRRMERDGLVNLSRGQQIRLTEDGTLAAESIIRRHMLAERLLVDVLKLEWADAHDEAHRMEHAISPRVEQQLMEMLNHPTTCPHGNPIPGLHGPLPETKPLSDVEEGEKWVINNISEHAEEDYDLMRYLQRSGLVPHTILQIDEVARANGTITVRLNGDKTVAVGLPAAQVIQVRTPA
jgi:DtxR family Mn-dependent transcriptional regulator